MRAYVGKKIFTERWNVDLDRCLVIFGTLSRMYDISHDDMNEASHTMLHSGALRKCSYRSGEPAMDLEAAALQKRMYSSTVRRHRI